MMWQPAEITKQVKHLWCSDRRWRFTAAAALACMPLILLAVYLASYPFSDEITRKTVSTSGLSPAQRSNIELAAQAIDGTVLCPGQVFSFNRTVGPRLEKRGYRSAPSYLGPESPATIGGGVCLVSSEIYQLALATGCEILERNPHLRTIKSVPPGLDATVWYGRSDLKFRNTLNVPVLLKTSSTAGTITVAMMGRRPEKFELAQVNRFIGRHNAREVVVEVMRKTGDQESMVSRDHYVITQ